MRLPPDIVRNTLRSVSELARALPRGGQLPGASWRTRHRGIVLLLWLHVAAFAGLAVANGLDLHQAGEFGSIGVLGALASWPRLSRGARTVLASAGLIACSGLLVHVSQGVIEMHFHFFVVVAIVSLYEEWIPLIMALGYVLLEHGVVGTLAPNLVYDHLDAWAAPWQWAILHAAFISAAGAANVVHWRLTELERERVSIKHRALIEAQAAHAAAQAEIATRRHVEAALQTQAFELEQQAHLLELAHDAMFVWEIESGAIRFWNRSAEELYGWTREQVLGRTPSEILKTEFPEPLARLHATLNATGRWQGELIHTRRDGSKVTVLSRWALSSSSEDGRPSTALATNTDMTEQKQARAELEYQAHHDPLTGLPNRARLHARIRQTLAVAGPLAPGALLMLDLDRFKDVNDTLGHGSGDTLLALVAERLSTVVRGGDTLARLGGDEFAVLLPSTSQRGAETLACRLLEALQSPFDVDGSSISIGASVGLALFPRHAHDPESLMRCADVAMYLAKRTGAGATVYDPSLDHGNEHRLTLASDLQRALTAGELLLHYQPKISCESAELVGVEALVRWEHPQRGMVPPDQFIPFAEQTGLIGMLGREVLRMAVRQCRAWCDMGLRVPVAVNLSMREMLDPSLPTNVAQLLSDTRLDPALLRVEITETSLMVDPLRARTTLEQLSRLGVKISVDDYGTGYSSLRYLHELPADELKIDRSFVKDLAVSENDQMIVRSTIDLAHGLGLKVVAEGVEDAAALALLGRSGCDYVQGYHLGRPMAAAAFVTWLARPQDLAAAA